jgi:hypothetical protein
MLGNVCFFHHGKWWWHSGKTFSSSSQGQGFESSSCCLHQERETVWEKFFIALTRGCITVVEHLPQHHKDPSQTAAAGSSGSTVVEHEPLNPKVEGLRPTAMT